MERETAEDERASLRDGFLPPLVTHSSDEVNGPNFPEIEFGPFDFRKE